MSLPKGPRVFNPYEIVRACMVDDDSFSLKTLFSDIDDPDERSWQMMQIFTPFLYAVLEPENHFEPLDKCFTALVSGALLAHPASLPANTKLKRSNENRIAEDIVGRLPPIPQRMFPLPFAFKGLVRGQNTVWDGWAVKFLVPEARQNFTEVLSDESVNIMETLRNVQEVAWNNLFVNVYMDTNTTIMAIKIAQQGGKANIEFAQELLQYLNFLAELIDEFESMLDKAAYGDPNLFPDDSPSVVALKKALFPKTEDGHKESRGILRIFFWTVWQRSVMLYFYYILEVRLNQGYSPQWNSLLAVRGVERLSDLDSGVYREDGIDYMCNWAFEVLRTSRSSICLDFRTMIARFNAHFGDRNGRCMRDSELTCLGDRPESCQRFTAAETSSQSFHASGCSGFCEKIMWSEKSYKSFTGPRAVRLDSGAKNLQYCQASPLTMAISHVWSHGQGGRPEHGINLCLHQLYMHLVALVGCESYWIDSTCIPSEHELRMEAINGINPVFTTSRVVLISDADLQSVDASIEDLNSLETLMSILLVCDWNVRAWTMLEAIRGRKNVFLLCKSGQVISMIELFRQVLGNGAVDLAVLLGSAQHLLPSSVSNNPIAIEDSGSLLSQRHASRPGDEVVIWSLLNNLPGRKSPLDLWRSQKTVRSGYLMSSTPRVDSDGYHWAPSEPYVRPQFRTASLGDDCQKMQNYMVCYRPYDGEGSFLANITNRGLEGAWCIRQVDMEVLATYRNNFCDKTPLGVGYPSEQELNPDLAEEDDVFEQPDTANACNMIEDFLKNDTMVRMVKPVASCGTKPYEGGSKRGEAYGLVGALCVLIAGSDTWKWKGVYQWLEAPDEFPFWEIDHMIIV